MFSYPKTRKNIKLLKSFCFFTYHQF